MEVEILFQPYNYKKFLRATSQERTWFEKVHCRAETWLVLN